MYNNFKAIVDKICHKSPLQRKKLESYLSTMGDSFFQEAEIFITKYIDYLANQGVTIDFAIESYLDMVKKMMKCQIEFLKTGSYPVFDSSEAMASVYTDEKKMKSYLFGLALSQFLWGTHYQIFKFFQSKIKGLHSQVNSYLEIGPGHGLFLYSALEYLDKNSNIIAVDISPVAITVTRSIMEYFLPQRSNDIIYYSEDMQKLNLDNKFDFITMGEVLEHVDCPDKLVAKLSYLLNEKGHAFISTCVNCPAIDHVYQFTSINEIRKLITAYGLNIEDELILPVENLPMNEIVEKKITINYCSLVKKATA